MLFYPPVNKVQSPILFCKILCQCQCPATRAFSPSCSAYSPSLASLFPSSCSNLLVIFFFYTLLHFFPEGLRILLLLNPSKRGVKFNCHQTVKTSYSGSTHVNWEIIQSLPEIFIWFPLFLPGSIDFCWRTSLSKTNSRAVLCLTSKMHLPSNSIRNHWNF